ncbi:MAG: LLM class flavin-dependent oxidoreductase [Thaumarchaeota archaeon]|nr:LLM class flavin-dependent oxidoreductase [Nitrososphaerota archaeon]
MKFGLRLADWFGTTQNMVDLAVLAEKNGFDYCWVSHDVFMRSSFVTLACIANHTNRMILGNTILNPYTTNPAELAMFVASLDEFTGGRAVCGISAGGLEYMKWLGIPAEKPFTRTREAVDLFRLLLSGKVAAYDGKEFQWSEQCYMRYKPFRSKIPVYIGGQGDKMLEYSGAAGDGALPILYPPEFAEYAVEKISEGIKKAGKNRSEVDIAGCVWMSIAKDREAAMIDPLKELVAYFGPLLGAKGLAAVGLTHEQFVPVHETFKQKGLREAIKLVTPEMLRLAILGSPDDCISQIEKLQKAGVDQVLIGAPLGPNPRESIDMIGREIIPRFRGE